jgi:outer membrane protein OmpA-like peptidoglycan-associated protein
MSFSTRIIFVFSLFYATIANAQNVSYYVVIGAFAKEENAHDYADKALSMNIPAVYSLSADKKLYYVYVRQSLDREKAQQTLGSVRDEGFKKAWIFQGGLGDFSMTVAPTRQNDIVIPEPAQESVMTASTSESVTTSEEKSEVIQTAGPRVVLESKEAVPAGKQFVFRLINEITGAPVTGVVRLQDSEKSNQFRGYNSQDKVQIVAPANRAGKWYVECQVVGFKPYRRQLNYTDPQKDKEIIVGSEQEFVVPMSLVRVKKGDYMDLDEVGFFSNASIFTPASERELKELLAMLQENPGYRIRVHGHTNGNEEREIISMGESTQFFSMDPTNKRAIGSAKELSSLRAEAVKNYLVANGVDPVRIDTRGEGGKQMVFDGTNAVLNDRVEIEVTRH